MDSQTNPAPTIPTSAPPAQPAQGPPVNRVSVPSQRDRIVVIGRRQCGKTVYLSTLYESLWRSRSHLTGKALTGHGHKHLMDAFAMLRKGEWPAATLGTARVELEIQYNGRKHLLVALDFAGEVFAKAFLHDGQQSPETAELLSHIDRAAAVILLVDPSVGFGTDHEAAMEEDFGFVQAAERIRNWPGGESVPVVVVLTKIDTHKKLVHDIGGPAELVRHHFPALARLLKQIPIFPVSAVQTIPDGKGRIRPSDKFTPLEIDKPLIYCLRAIHDSADQKSRQLADQQQRQRVEMELARQGHWERKLNIILVAVVSAIILAGAAITIFLLLHHK